MRPPCKTAIRAANDSGRRTAKPKYIVIHSTESDNRRGMAEAIARFFARPSTEASVQLTVDDFDCYRSLPDNVIPWGAPPFNSRGLHVEQCGRAKWSRAEWMKHRRTLIRTAQYVAQWCVKYDIPPLWLTIADCKKHKSGITSHRNVSRAFGMSSHWDPGDPTDNKHYPYDFFMRQVKEAIDGLH